jgi:hypothetical protein
MGISYGCLKGVAKKSCRQKYYGDLNFGGAQKALSKRELSWSLKYREYLCKVQVQVVRKWPSVGEGKE